MKILTTKSIENMKAGLGEVLDGRVPGLSVFSGKRGPVSFGLRYRRPGSGRTAKITIGRVNLGDPLDDPQRGDPLTLAQARALALDLQQKIVRGVDPGRDQHRRDTFGEVMDRYFRERASVTRTRTLPRSRRSYRPVRCAGSAPGLGSCLQVKRMCERINAEARTPKSRVARRGVLDHEVPEGEEQAYACADAAAASVKDQFNGA